MQTLGLALAVLEDDVEEEGTSAGGHGGGGGISTTISFGGRGDGGCGGSGDGGDGAGVGDALTSASFKSAFPVRICLNSATSLPAEYKLRN